MQKHTMTAKTAPNNPPREILRLATARFTIITGIIGDWQGRAIAFAFYFTVLVPFGIGSRLFTDPLRLRDERPTWVERDPVSSELDDARSQG